MLHLIIECRYDIFKTSSDQRDRETSVWLIKDLACHKVLPWIKEFLQDENENIRTIGIGVLDQFYFRNPGFTIEVGEIAEVAIQNKNKYVAKMAKHILENIKKSDLREKILSEAAEKYPDLNTGSFDWSNKDEEKE